jgi:hypothetical protein
LAFGAAWSKAAPYRGRSMVASIFGVPDLEKVSNLEQTVADLLI